MQNESNVGLEGRVVALETALGVVDPAETERIQRERELQRAEYVRSQKALKVELRSAVAAYLEDTRKAELAVRELAAAIGRILTHSATISRISHLLSQKAAPLATGVSEVTRRLACRICAVLSTSHPNHRNRLAHVELQAGHHKATDDWVERESAMCKNHIEPLLSEGN
jgi:DNA repair exonuclease SbcCD ATPase subunit